MTSHEDRVARRVPVLSKGKCSRVIVAGLTALWVSLVLVALFSFDYGAPELDEAGVGVSPIIRFGHQSGNEFYAAWLFVGEDEWGGSLGYLRELAVYVWLPTLTVLTLVGWLERRRRSWGESARRVALGAGTAVCFLGYFVHEYANYAIDAFALRFGVRPSTETTIVRDASEIPAWSLACSREWLEASEAVEEMAPIAALVVAGLVVLQVLRRQCSGSLSARENRK